MIHRSFLIFLVVAASCLAQNAPIVPGEGKQTLDLKKDNKIVAKIEGNIEWFVNYTTTDDKTKLAHFTLANQSYKVAGSQNAKMTEFFVNWNKNFVWRIVFLKNNDGQVSFANSTFEYNLETVGDAKFNNTQFNVTWTTPVPLTHNSKLAYKCSDLTIVDNATSGQLKMTDVQIQPFDLDSEKFGKTDVCPRDQPAPAPAETIGNWTVSDKSGPDTYTCIRLMANLSLSIKYQLQNNTNGTALVQVPSKAVVGTESTCNYDFSTKKFKNDDQVLQLKFSANKNNDWTLTLKFTNNSLYTRDTTNRTVQVYWAKLDYSTMDESIFPNASKRDPHLSISNTINETSGDGSLKMFKTDTSHCYRCNSDEQTDVTPQLSVRTQKLKVEAFLSNSTALLAEQACLADQQNETSDLVPIIIGAALAALVVFVLIAYLVGRARARASTYETI